MDEQERIPTPQEQRILREAAQAGYLSGWRYIELDQQDICCDMHDEGWFRWANTRFGEMRFELTGSGRAIAAELGGDGA